MEMSFERFIRSIFSSNLCFFPCCFSKDLLADMFFMKLS